MKIAKRAYWVDNIRVFAIFLVVLGHYQIPSIVKNYIYSFHMPLFFFIAGIFFSKEKYENIFSLIKHRSKTLLIPYFFLANTQISYNLLKLLVKDEIPSFQLLFFLISKAEYEIILFSNYWFIGAIFFTEIGYFFLMKIISKKFILFIIVLSASIGGYFLNTAGAMRPDLPYLGIIRVFFTSVVFYSLGNNLKGYMLNEKLPYFLNSKYWIAFFILTVQSSPALLK